MGQKLTLQFAPECVLPTASCTILLYGEYVFFGDKS